jgi:oligopeptide/dipeptide ABC transporter ATP-binding protein
VFQDPYHSLNPTMTVEQMLTEPLKVHFGSMTRTARHARAVEVLEQVGLASYHLRRKPMEFSGGQRQRLAIARALIMEPQLIICDEPVSALDVSTQSQVINLLESLQQRLGLSYLFIAHDLAVVRHTSHRIAVMYRGRLAETGPAERVYVQPGHPYTKRLLASIPFPDPVRQAAQRDARRALAVHAPSGGGRVTAGCPFAPRCPFAMDRCWNEVPPLYEIDGGGSAACFLLEGARVHV